MEFIYSSSIDKEFLDDIEDKGLNKYIGCNCCINTWKYFTLVELEEEAEQSVNSYVIVCDILTIKQVMMGLFQIFTNFTLGVLRSWQSLWLQSVLVMGGPQGNHTTFFKQLSKFVLKYHLFSFILYIKHNNVITYNVFI
jgi:hypothetical protein